MRIRIRNTGFKRNKHDASLQRITGQTSDQLRIKQTNEKCQSKLLLDPWLGYWKSETKQSLEKSQEKQRRRTPLMPARDPTVIFLIQHHFNVLKFLPSLSDPH